MTGISIVAESSERLAAIRAMLPCDIAADYLRPDDLPPGPQDTIVLDLDLGRLGGIQTIRTWLSNRAPLRGTVIVFVDDMASHLQLTQARALGATEVLPRPVSAAQLGSLLLDRHVAPSLQPEIDDPSEDLKAVGDIFAAARAHQSPNMEFVTEAGARIVDRLKDIGLSAYLAAIRAHHSRTYTHCLTVTAVAVSFGIQLGFNRKDTKRLAVAGLLHDIGKSQISVDILEKPAALDERETLIMRSHPVVGHDMLIGTPGLPDDTLDMVLHHHEYLDGSGYPHGLQASQISDLNRMMTIADVYGALIEPRSYRPLMPATQALDVLRAMGPKLDVALVRVFTPLADNLAACVAATGR